MNRHGDAARGLADELNTVRAGVARAVSETAIGEAAAGATLIVNSTVKGQSGIRKLPGGQATCLEPYSCLAPADPALVPDALAAQAGDFYATWFARSAADIDANHRQSTEVVRALGREVAFCDIVYAPLETTFLRQGRLSGHRTVNGKGMNVAQAASGFFQRVMQRFLRARGLETPETYGRVLEAMTRAW